jgi:hypothetical protein
VPCSPGIAGMGCPMSKCLFYRDIQAGDAINETDNRLDWAPGRLFLAGPWLDRAGFKPGHRMQVFMEQPGCSSLRFLAQGKGSATLPSWRMFG